MWGTLFVVGMWLTPTPIINTNVVYEDSLYQWSDTTSVVLVEFSEPMSLDGLTDPHNYKLYDSTATTVKIYKVGRVDLLDGIPITDTTLVALITKRLNKKEPYVVQVFNVKDKAGNVIGDDNEGWFYFNGFTPNMIQTPAINWRRNK